MKPECTFSTRGSKGYCHAESRIGFAVDAVSVFGCDPKHELWPEFAPYQLENPVTKEKIFVEYAEQGVRFAMVNLASKRWRDLFVSRMKALRDGCGIDAIHLDQLVAIENVGQGLVDGMNPTEGTMAILRELRQALPNVAIGSECLNEVICPYISFAQWFAPGMGRNAWSQAHVDTAHPVAVYVFRPYTIPYAHLRFPPPPSDQFFAAFTNCYEDYGVLPTLSHLHPALLQRPVEGFLRQLFDEVRFFQSHRVEPDLDTEWPPEMVFAFRTADGARARRVRKDGVTTLELMADPPRVISRTLRGRHSVTCRGTVAGALAYRDGSVFGLDPEKWYPCFDDGPRDGNAFHISGLPPDACVADVASFEGGTEFSISLLHADSKENSPVRTEFQTVSSRPFVLTSRVEPVRMRQVGDGKFTMTTVLPNTFYCLSPTPPIALPADLARMPFHFLFYDHGDNRIHASFFGDPEIRQIAVAGETKRGIFAHPPTSGGRTLVRFPIALPDGTPRLRSFAGLKDGSRSGGCLFIVKVNGVETARQRALPNKWYEIEVDLSKWAGKPVLLSLVVDADGSASWDWACWGKPRIE